MFLLALSSLFVFQTRWTIQLYLHCVEWSFAFSRYVEQWQEGTGPWSRTRRTRGCGKHFTPSSNILPWESHRFREEFYNFQGKNRLSRIHSNLISILFKGRFYLNRFGGELQGFCFEGLCLMFPPNLVPRSSALATLCSGRGWQLFCFHITYLDACSLKVEVLTQAPRATTVHAVR